MFALCILGLDEDVSRELPQIKLSRNPYTGVGTQRPCSVAGQITGRDRILNDGIAEHTGGIAGVIIRRICQIKGRATYQVLVTLLGEAIVDVLSKLRIKRSRVRDSGKKWKQSGEGAIGRNRCAAKGTTFG